MELLAEYERKYRAPALSIPFQFPLPSSLPSLFNPRYAPSSPAIQDSPPPSNERWGVKEKERRKAKERERERKGDAPIYRESIVSFISVPQADYLFRFPAGRALGEALIVTASLSYGSGKLRTVKASLRQAASQNLPPSLRTNIWDTLRSYEAHQEPIGIDQCWFYCDLYHILSLFRLFLFLYKVSHHPSFIKRFLDQFEVTLSQMTYWIINLYIKKIHE